MERSQALGQKTLQTDSAPQLKLMLLDGHAMVHRAWYAIRNPLTVSSTGQDVRAVYGFAQMLRKAQESFRPSHIAMTFDTPAPTFRHDQFPEYKAQRSKMPDDLRVQFPLVKKLMEAYQIPVFEKDGYEADDLLGTLSAQAESQGIHTLVLTGDTDILQLVSPKVNVILQQRQGEQLLYDEKRIRERYGGLTPQQLIHLKALRGDPSDNIRGIPGIGEKTAILLLQTFGSIENIFENLDKIPDRQKVLLEENRHLADQALGLIQIVRNVPISLNIEQCRWGQYSRDDVVAFLRELEFNSLINGVAPGKFDSTPLNASPSETEQTVQYETVTDSEALVKLVSKLGQAEGISFDVETSPVILERKGIDPMLSSLVGISFATAPGLAWYVPLGHVKGTQVDLDQALKQLKPILEDPHIYKAAHNANFDMTVLWNYGISVNGLKFDTMLAAHLMGYKGIGLKNMALSRLGIEMTAITDLIGTGRTQSTMDLIPIESVADYAAADADMTFRLWEALDVDLKKSGLVNVLTEVEMPLVPVLVNMQANGIKLDVPLLKGMAADLGTRLAELESEVYESVGHTFNMNSPSQLGELLFQELRLHEKVEGMTRPRRTKTGAYSTDATVLEYLYQQGAHPVVALVLENRQLAKLKSTYVDALPALVNPHTGRVHTSYNQAGSVTGRISSNEPNLQNIPIGTELGRKIRFAFIPKESDWVLLAADYSQIELRVLAHLSQDQALLDAFHKGLDIHSATASQVFGVPVQDISPYQRRIAKVLNFGVIYGVSPFGIARQTDLNVEEGRLFISNYLTRYPGAAQYMERTKDMARNKGYVEKLLGRRRATPDIHANNQNIRQAAEREAINMPVQGTAAEVMKLAMLKIFDRMESERFAARMLLQVHDELVFEAPTDEVEKLKELILGVMPSAMNLDVPLDVSIKIGTSWGTME